MSDLTKDQIDALKEYIEAKVKALLPTADLCESIQLSEAEKHLYRMLLPYEESRK